MAKLNIEDVEHIAKLSRLSLTNEEKERFSTQLSSILDYVEQLGKIDTDNIEPTANITGLSNVMRDDAVLESGISHEDIASNAPEFKDGSFVVPAVFE